MLLQRNARKDNLQDLDILKRLQINILFTEALEQMPTYEGIIDKEKKIQ